MPPDVKSALEVAQDFPEAEMTKLRPDAGGDLPDKAGQGGVQASGEFQAKRAADVKI